MINLIPPKAKKDLLVEYWARVISAWVTMWSMSLLLGATLLIPVYVLIDSQISVIEDRASEASTNVANHKALSTELRESSVMAVSIVNDLERLVFSELLDSFQALENNSVVVNKIELSENKTESPIVIGGTAQDRNALASFRDRILAHEMVTEVDLPISNLSKDRDIPFTLNVTLINQNEV